MSRPSLKHLHPGWYATVMGLAGLSLAWQSALPMLGDAAGALAWVFAVSAAVALVALMGAGAWRALHHRDAWAEDLSHPLRHLLVATLPMSWLLLVTAAVGAGLQGIAIDALWWVAALSQLSVTTWVIARGWRARKAGAAYAASISPALFLPVVGNVLVPLAGIPLGHSAWSAFQFGIGFLFWPVILVLLLKRQSAGQLGPERQLPAHFIFIAPPSLVGLVALRFDAPPTLAWVSWAVGAATLLWVARLLKRIGDQPFGIGHWAMSFPLAAFTSLTLRLGSAGTGNMPGIALLALTSLLIAALILATLRGLREGSLLVPESLPIRPVVAPVHG